MQYPGRFEPADGGGFVVTFRDIPEAVTQGETLEEARAMAEDALVTAMDFYFEDGRLVPPPSPAKRGEEMVDLPASLWAKVLLLNEMVAQKVSKAELARRMGTTRQEVNRITDVHHATKIDNVATAVEALGKKLLLAIEAQKEAPRARG